jgi:sugar phosphate isomerase/epimerase
LKLGVFTPVFGTLDVKQMLRKVQALGKVQALEIGTGGWPGNGHLDMEAMLSDPLRLSDYRKMIADAGLTISALSCHGNPLHPDPARAASDHADFLGTCRLAAELEVAHVSLLAGLPAGAPEDTTPNWIINSSFPGLDDVYRWQWEERVLPYWRAAAAVADDHGVTLCIEPHSADVVFNTPTFARLREEIGPTIAMNFDPSHLWWQGIDPIAVVDAVGDAIQTCHVKDALMDARRIARDGALSPRSYDRWDERPWAFATPGYGHPELFWRRLVVALRRAGYSGTLSVECEDPFLSPDDTLDKSVDVLRRALPDRPAPGVDWASRVAFKEDVSGLAR